MSNQIPANPLPLRGSVMTSSGAPKHGSRSLDHNEAPEDGAMPTDAASRDEE